MTPSVGQNNDVTASLIGVSGFAAVHYHDLLRQGERGEMRVCAATVINQEEEREKCDTLRSLGCELFTDYREMLARTGSVTDLCFIPTGIALHAPMTIAALRAGANVMVEKPAAATIQDVRAMQAAERETGRFVAVGYQTMYAAETLRMKRAICEGKIGALRAIKCRGLWPRLDSYYQRNNWTGKLKVGGDWVLDSPANNAMAHQLNMICFLAGSELLRTAALSSIQAELYRAHEIESADTTALRIVTQSGVPLYFLVTHCSEKAHDPEIVVEGERGRIHWTFDRTTRIEVEGEPAEEIPCEAGLDLRDSMMRRLRERVNDPSVFICDLSIAAAQTICVNGAHESSAVHAVDPRFVRRSQAGDSVKTVIAGIDELIARAFESGKLFSELGAEWARPGHVIPLDAYAEFPRPGKRMG